MDEEDNAFFIRPAGKQDTLTAPSTTPLQRDPSFVGIVSDFNTATSLEEPDQSAFYLDDEVTHESPPPRLSASPVPLDMSLIAQFAAIPDNVKEEICLVLQERDIDCEALLDKSDEDIEFLFPNLQACKYVKEWKELETWKREQLPTEALRLTKAIKAGNLEIVKEIAEKPTIPKLGKPLLINHPDDQSHNRTPLMHAARYGQFAIVGYLVKAQNADIYLRDAHKLESMAIHFAAQNGQVEIVRFLIGIDPKLVEAKNRHGDTPLNMAAVAGKLAVVECLVNEKRANIENRGQYGMTPLVCAAEKGHASVIRFLADKGADICAKDEKYSDMAVHWSARFGHLDVVSYLVEQRPSLVDAINGLGRTPLHQAALGGHLAVVKHLAKKGADLGTMSNSEDLMSNAIHLAAYFGHVAVVTFLLDNNPGLLEVENKDGKTPFMLAKEEKREEIMKLLEGRGARTTPKNK